VPISRNFNEVIKTSNTTGIIDFSGYIEYQVGSSSVLTLQVTALPVNGLITVSGSNAILDTSYAVNVLTYTSNASECTSIMADSFRYKVVDGSTEESTVSVVNLTKDCSNKSFWEKHLTIIMCIGWGIVLILIL